MIRPSALLMSVCVIACSAPQPDLRGDGPPALAGSARGNATSERATAGAAAIPDFAALVKRQGAAVVSIRSRGIARRIDVDHEPTEVIPQGPVYDFSRRFTRPDPRDYPMSNEGSGFLLSEDGYILTNAHLVADMDEATVKLTDKREFTAQVVGFDLLTDVALLKIDARGLPRVRIGDPSQLQVGEWVAAIGSPFGFENSVTAGIVSGKGRFIPDETDVPLIQSDVVLNPGNSGGPLFNLRGEVVGINSMIYTGTGGYMGVSFAVPIDFAMKVADELRRAGRVTRGRLGAQIQEVTPDLARSFVLRHPAGALINRVEAGSPAEMAGLTPGDIILKVGDVDLDSANDLPRIIGATRPGAIVPLAVWRHGAARRLMVTIGEQPAERMRKLPVPDEIGSDRLGLVLNELTASQRDALHAGGNLLVRDVHGPALRAGIEQGDLIVAVNDIRVDRVADFNDTLDAIAPGTMVALLVLRVGEPAYVPVRLGP